MTALASWTHDGRIRGDDLGVLFRVAGAPPGAVWTGEEFDDPGSGADGPSDWDGPLNPLAGPDQDSFCSVLDGDCGYRLSDDELARVLAFLQGPRRPEQAEAPCNSECRAWALQRLPPELVESSARHGLDPTDPRGVRELCRLEREGLLLEYEDDGSDGGADEGWEAAHTPGDFWGHYSPAEVAVRGQLAGQLMAALAANTHGGRLRAPELEQLCGLAGSTLPRCAAFGWVEAGLALDPADEGDFLCFLDILDNAAGFQLTNNLERVLHGLTASPSSASGEAPTHRRGPAPLGRAPGASVAAATASAPRGVGPVAAATGAAGRGWDYSRFDAVCDSSDDEAASRGRPT